MYDVEKFVSIIADELEMEVGELSGKTEFKTVEGWGSVSALGIIAEIEEQFGVQLGKSDIDNATTIEDLATITKGKA